VSPIDSVSLELQSDGKVAVGKPLAIHNASEPFQVAFERLDHQSLVQFERVIRQDPDSQ
jgi:hypothetical protein